MSDTRQHADQLIDLMPETRLKAFRTNLLTFWVQRQLIQQIQHFCNSGVQFKHGQLCFCHAWTRLNFQQRQQGMPWLAFRNFSRLRLGYFVFARFHRAQPLSVMLFDVKFSHVDKKAG